MSAIHKRSTMVVATFEKVVFHASFLEAISGGQGVDLHGAWRPWMTSTLTMQLSSVSRRNFPSAMMMLIFPRKNSDLA